MLPRMIATSAMATQRMTESMMYATTLITVSAYATPGAGPASACAIWKLAGAVGCGGGVCQLLAGGAAAGGAGVGSGGGGVGAPPAGSVIEHLSLAGASAPRPAQDTAPEHVKEAPSRVVLRMRRDRGSNASRQVVDAGGAFTNQTHGKAER